VSSGIPSTFARWPLAAGTGTEYATVGDSFRPPCLRSSEPKPYRYRVASRANGHPSAHLVAKGLSVKVVDVRLPEGFDGVVRFLCVPLWSGTRSIPLPAWVLALLNAERHRAYVVALTTYGIPRGGRTGHRIRVRSERHVRRISVQALLGRTESGNPGEATSSDRRLVERGSELVLLEPEVSRELHTNHVEVANYRLPAGQAGNLVCPCAVDR